MSSRSFGELELEEAKGFMDLGFVFKQEHMSPRMMTVVPGLQRLGLCSKSKLHDPNLIDLDGEIAGDVELGQEEKVRSVVRPYLSEAWLIRRPDSPLLNLRLPKVSSAAAMKKHLKFWARAVASVIKQES
uniref:Uncharacterized protein n=1 Tax=Rhizophora mucronata TaxID=61149 RepID=A0A2P2PMI7_RHIMU